MSTQIDNILHRHYWLCVCVYALALVSHVHLVMHKTDNDATHSLVPAQNSKIIIFALHRRPKTNNFVNVEIKSPTMHLSPHTSDALFCLVFEMVFK